MTGDKWRATVLATFGVGRIFFGDHPAGQLEILIDLRHEQLAEIPAGFDLLIFIGLEQRDGFYLDKVIAKASIGALRIAPLQLHPIGYLSLLEAARCGQSLSCLFQNLRWENGGMAQRYTFKGQLVHVAIQQHAIAFRGRFHY